MNGSKDWYKSKTVWAGVVTMVIGILSRFGIGAVEGTEDSIVEVIMQFVTIGGGIMTIIGRVVAKGKIKPSGLGPYSLILVICLIGVLASAGCNKVNMDQAYGSLLDRTAAWSADVAAKAANGEMTPDQMSEALQINAELWQRFENAKNGIALKGGE